MQIIAWDSCDLTGRPPPASRSAALRSCVGPSGSPAMLKQRESEREREYTIDYIYIYILCIVHTYIICILYIYIYKKVCVHICTHSRFYLSLFTCICICRRHGDILTYPCTNSMCISLRTATYLSAFISICMYLFFSTVCITWPQLEAETHLQYLITSPGLYSSITWVKCCLCRMFLVKVCSFGLGS